MPSNNETSDTSTTNPHDTSNGTTSLEYEYVFGFGSIMNSSTHAAWNNNDDGNSKPLAGRIVRIRRDFGYERRWNFRSPTGFTALGVSRIDPYEYNNNNGQQKKPDMNGVMFQVPCHQMPGFDRREVGYDKVQIPLNYIDFCDHEYESQKSRSSSFELTPNDKIWIYVPQANQNREADENHPLIQSYVDVVLQGCLEWGGKPMATDFVLSTENWSPFFLNDTPSSRRPWLFRKDYDIIDSILKEHSQRTYYADRRHPEEFASTFLLRRMRGTWSIPRRNPSFTGRDSELAQLHGKLQSAPKNSVQYLFVHGMGGVGKSSLCNEYCYRQYPTTYGLVVWLNAESAETLVVDYRQLLADLADGLDDTTTSNPNKDNNTATEEIIREVKTRLFRCQVPWLLVFDNLEDRKLLDAFVPRGATSTGYVLVTSRMVEWESAQFSSALNLGCLSPNESVAMLRRLGSSGERKFEETAARDICDKLGHLPLALGMAAAYMQRCDVSCGEYMERYVRWEETGRSLLGHQAGRLHDYSLTVSASLAVSLNAIENESQIASDVLKLLCWLGPDNITKPLIRALLSTKNRADEQLQKQKCQEKPLINNKTRFQAAAFLTCGVVLGCTAILLPRKISNNRIIWGTGLLSILSLSATASTLLASKTTMLSPEEPPPRRESSSGRIVMDEFEQTDVVWNILKSFSILTVKEGKGNMHRLLAQALRSAEDQEECCRNLQICVDAMPGIWKFVPRNAETWQESFHVIEHLKSLVSHIATAEVACPDTTLRAGILSTEAGVFSAMAMNGFKEAQSSLELALKIFDRAATGKRQSHQIETLKAKSEANHELGRVLRYQGNFSASEERLLSALSMRNELVKKDASTRHFVADTLHELGVLEVKKHSLDTAQAYLTKALDLRRTLEEESSNVDADCAATLHQLAAVHVARKPPSLEQAEELLQDALKLSRQIGQRAATLKQLARVTIRRGLLDTAEGYLRQALELYIELYGERTMHINVAAVKFQQGALACQREQYEVAWIHFSECLRIRRHVYAYARSHDAQESDASKSNPLHLEVSCVLHELGCVAFAQERFSQALNMLKAERSILQQLQDASNQTERVRQAMLTNLTWLRKCAKEMGNDAAVADFTAERAQLKNSAKMKSSKHCFDEQHTVDDLKREAIQCRLYARQLALQKNCPTTVHRDMVMKSLSSLAREIQKAESGSMKNAAQDFYNELSMCLRNSTDSVPRNKILNACDALRDILRAHGTHVSDKVSLP